MIDENILIDRLHDNKEAKMNISVPNGYYDVARRAWDACIKKVCKLIEELQRIDTWIPCSERLPEEHDSIFAQFKDTDQWSDAMFEKNSDDVNVTVEFENGKRKTKTLHTIDGKWSEGNRGVKFKVIAWQPLPEEYHG